MKVGSISATSQSTVYIFATTLDGTRAALTVGVPLARGAGARLIVLVPQIVPYPLPVDGPVDATAFIERRHRDLVYQANGEAEIQIYLCRTSLDVIQALPREATVIVGGSGGTMWPSREERLAHHLTRLGYQMVFAATTRGTLVCHSPVLATILSLLGAPRVVARLSETSAPRLSGVGVDASRRRWEGREMACRPGVPR